jgi:tetratricopeptide (TPR) repeat protein
MTALAALFLVVQIVVPAAGDVDAQLDAVRRQLREASRPVEARASLALEEAASLDKVAQVATAPDDRRTRAIQAVTLLDEFNAAHPRHSLEVPVAIQAAVYLWADGRRETDDWRLHPRTDAFKTRAREVLDSTIIRFERIEPALSGVDPLVAQNARFRHAQTIADRARLEVPGSPAERDILRKALVVLDPMPSETAIVGFAHLLRAEIRARLGEFVAAERDLEEVAKAKERPDPDAIVDVRSAILTGQRRFSTAIKVIDESSLDPIAKAAIGIKARLAERKAISAGRDRRDADDDALERARRLRGSSRIDARLALIDLARDLDRPPGHSDADAWEILADGAIELGDPARACRLIEEGADRAEGQKHRDDAGRLRLKEGAILFQDGKFADADAMFTRVWNDPRSGPARPKAGMFRVLARGKRLGGEAGRVSRSSYLAAVNELIRDYPNDPATGEARWLLGRAEVDAGRPAEAIAQWEAISQGQPRWLSARLAIADQNQRELDALRIANEPGAVAEKYKAAALSIRKALAIAGDGPDAIDLELASIRLELTPEIGHPERALAASDRISHRPASDPQRAQARMLRVVALAETQKFGEAETTARAEAPRASIAGFLRTARLLDHSADATESDVNRSRTGRILRLFLQAGVRHVDAMTPGAVAEYRLRVIRAEIAIGDSTTARRGFAGPQAPNLADLDADGLRDLADAYMRVEAYGMAIDVERLRVRGLKPGTPAWLESRYGLSLALYRDRKPRDARRVIDATSILHPDLGGGSLKTRFEHLRQRIEPE